MRRLLPAFGKFFDNDKLCELTVHEDLFNNLHFDSFVCAHMRPLLADRLRWFINSQKLAKMQLYFAEIDTSFGSRNGISGGKLLILLIFWSLIVS